jgi:hypothetical protein
MFRSALFVAGVVLLSAVLALAQDPSRQWGPNGVGCDLRGNGGQIVLYPPGDTNKWIKLQFFKLQEVDVNGNVVAQADNFGGFGFNWTPFGTTTVFNASALQFSISEPSLHIHTLNAVNHSLANDFIVSFKVTSFLFLQNFTTQFAGENIIGKAGQVKWQLELGAWKFQNAANKLQYGIQLFSSQVANNTGYKRLDHVPGTISSFAIGFGVGNIIVPTVAQEDGLNVNIATNVTYAGGQLSITWDFPSYNTSLVYDPVTATSDLVIADATTTTTSGVASEKSVSAMAVIAAVAVAMWAMNRQD